jgi:hypothetical protein
MFRAAFTSALSAAAQARQAKTAWLLWLPAAIYPHPLHRCEVYAEVTFWIRPGALASRRLTSKPQPDRMISRFSPALAATFRPGWPTVPFADRAVPWIRRSSTRMTSN